MTPLLLSAAVLLEAQAAEARWALPPLLLVAVCVAESNGQRRVFPDNGGCSVGPAGVYVPGCESARMRQLLRLSVNLDTGASLLARSREKCRRHPRWAACRRSEWALYNAGSRGWWGRVERIWRRLRGRGGES